MVIPVRLASFTFDALFRLQNEVHIDGIVVGVAVARVNDVGGDGRSEEHTSELQSQR